jgi:hypothetical protein
VRSARGSREGRVPLDAHDRREKLLQMLAESPEAKYAMLSDLISEPGFVIVAVAIRGIATADILIQREQYDGPKILDLVERFGSTTH